MFKSKQDDRFAAFRARKTIVHTNEQKAIYAKIKAMAPGGCVGIIALAGTGKTTTAVESLHHLPDWLPENKRVIYLAFGRDSAEDIKGRIPPNVEASTFHSLASKIVKPRGMNKGKLWKHAGLVISEYKLRAPAVALVQKAKNLAVGIEGSPYTHELSTWVEMIQEYGIRHKNNYKPEQVARAGMLLFDKTLEDLSEMDFDDLLYHAAKHGPGKGFRTFDAIFVDEAQDTNPTQILFLDKLLDATNNKAVLVLIGDPKQAIFGWRGAGVDAFEVMIDRYNASVLALTTTWRCATSIVREAQKLVPDIHAREGAPEGVVEHITIAEFDPAQIADGDVVLCRNNAPLMGAALETISSGRRACVLGRDLKKVVTDTLNEILSDVYGPELRNTSYFDIAHAVITEECGDRPVLLDKRHDDLWTARYVWQILLKQYPDKVWRGYIHALEDLNPMLDALLADEKKQDKSSLIFCSIHRSKGLEWETVWYLAPELLPSRNAKKLGGWHVDQEINLDYVARTRAKTRLVYVHDKSVLDEGDES